MIPLFSSDLWLADTMSRSVFKLENLKNAQTEDLLSVEMTNLVQSGNAMFYAKLPTAEVVECLALSRVGFDVIDTAITFESIGSTGRAPSDVRVGIAHSANYEEVAAIAESCFQWSRFHLDPRIPTELANLIKRRWIESYFYGLRGSTLYVGQIGGTIAGFLAVLQSGHVNRTAAVIDLIGVAPQYQGRGVGTALVKRFVDEWRHRSDLLRVGTQAANIASMRLYERNGFSVVESNFVMHAHFLSGVICQ